MSPGADSQNPPSPVQQAAGDINLGVTAHGIGDFNGAIRYYNQAIKVLTDICQANKNSQPSSCQLLAKAYSNRSYSYFRLQNYNQALEDANSAVVLDSNLAEARINLANARFMQGDRAEAIQDYNRALELKPSPSLQAGIYNNRGNVYFSQNSLQTALKDYDQALALRNDYADAYFNRGLVHERQNNINNAISDFQNAAKFYREQNALDLAQEAERRATNLQQNAPKSTALPPG
jgi:tetratricopeptide (TPR) repeat protein